MDKRSKNMPKFGAAKLSFTPNLGFKRNVAKGSDQLAKVEVKVEHDANSSAQLLSAQKQKKTKERSTTQIQSVFSNMSSTSQGRSGPSRMGLSSGFRSYSNLGSFNSSGSYVKKEACQSIQQMQMIENAQFDIDDPIDEPHGPIRLPFFKKDRVPQIKTEMSLEYPFQKNIYPSLSELISPELLITLQFYDSSFSIQPKIANIDLGENNDNDVMPLKLKSEVPIKMEYNGHLKTENDTEAVFKSKPIGKLQYFRSGRVVLIFNEKKYELLKATEDKHHKELFSLTKIEEAERPDKLVSLGTVPRRLKAVLSIDNIIEHFMTNSN
ncbi:uncharacterized protein LOC111038390 isoform X2 [Myzus persicae]|uniref:uncharacterized protein LOC111037629 isoform X2 n=1 Tax=Myzus persicae TaxID=13164 RepID=UPI000B938FEA|nr:uncharacterized protein LOC111037629 isoform X2 [Myzus persicae]XP_022177154.1 uncharacterized protein LOC111038390 isoform X2 [Myzus persicae]